ncbi:protein FAM166C-like [Bombus bifarius]|uniref:Protein FAM166C-like n=1 Tax=Bombus bifarius TaxID=103933 RepID=A0A6P8N706_9HYME|nr:protein FAM166C-like [Bombus bifarius]
MVVSNKKMSETQAMFYPPSLMPAFMGAYPPTKLSLSLYEGGSIGYFQNYRNETLSKFSMLPYEWGMQKTPYSPRPDIVADTVRRKINRELTVLSNDISTIDNTRMKEVDDLFKGVQIHRSQYKDRTGSFHPLTFFKPDTYMYQCAPGMTTSYFLKYPTNYVKHKMPIVLPLTYERRMQTSYIPDLSLSGIYNKSSCIAYKR